jgi:hypothetical protein
MSRHDQRPGALDLMLCEDTMGAMPPAEPTSGEGAGCLMKSEEGGGGAVRGRPGVFMGENIMEGPLKWVTCWGARRRTFPVKRSVRAGWARAKLRITSSVAANVYSVADAGAKFGIL